MKKIILSIASIAMLTASVNAADIRPIVSVEVGYESGSIDNDYTVSGGINISDTDDYDYDGATFRISGGISIPHESLESRVQLFVAGGSGEIDYKDGDEDDVDSSEFGISYDLLFGKDNIRPFIGVEVASGKSEIKDGDGDIDIDYTSYGIYGGIVYEISNNFDFTARAGYKQRDYDNNNGTEIISGTTYYFDEDLDYSGAEVAIGLTYKF